MAHEEQKRQEGLFSGFFSKIFTGKNDEDKIYVTSIATNGKTIILGYSNGTCQEYDLSLRKLLDQTHQLTTSKKPVSKMEVKYYETPDKSVKTTILITLINGIVKWWNYDNISLYTRFNLDGIIDF